MPGKTCNTINLLNKIDQALEAADKKMTFENGLSIAKEVIALLGIGTVQADLKSFPRLKANPSWTKNAPDYEDRKASFALAENNDRNIDFKLYWVTKPAKRIISNLAALTPNFEDEPFYSNKSVGIDFILPDKPDRLIVVLSNSYKIRVLEIHRHLSNTQKKIFEKWAQEFDFSNKAQVHKILWDSFDIQPLNKEFYLEISSFFNELVQHLEKEDILDKKHRPQFVNRLIGRIIFCWFLRKKEMISESAGYFNTDEKQAIDYYAQKLETLFFKVLNTPLEERGFGIDDKTPFLNGGLFEEKASDLAGRGELSFPANYFDRFYSFLNRYNFTTDESTSDFQQVAIDPEMLGRIFENLLAEEIEETGEQARKAKGAFYTPREIVDYMCRESLRAYISEKLGDDTRKHEVLQLLFDKKEHELDPKSVLGKLSAYKSRIIEALDEIKIIDPACGSGAFPIGMLQIMLSIYERLDARLDHYKTKLAIIKNNIFGVDIEPMAVEISRLRAWLSLVVDSVIMPSEKNKGIEELPNLDFKFICANSLIPLEQTEWLFDNKKMAEQMQAIRERYFKTDSLRIKDKMKQDFEDILKNNQNIFASPKQKQLLTYHPFDSDNVTKFFDSQFIFGVDKFDVIVANPPYIKEYVYKNAFDGLRDSPYYQGKMDIWYLFACKGIDWLKDKGMLTFIAQNNWVTSYGSSKMRNKVIEDTQILRLIDFGDFKIFENAGIQTMIMMFKKDKISEAYSFDYRRLRGEGLVIEDVVAIFNKNDSIKAEYLLPKIDRRNLENKKLTFSNSEAELLLDKILAKANFKLDSDKEVAQGIVCPQDYVNKASQEVLCERFKIGDGIFTLSNDEVKAIGFSKKELDIIKPFYTTYELQKWHGNPANEKWVIYTDSSFKDKKKIEEYPHIKKHLDQFKKVITSDNRPYGLHRSRDERFFKGEKIIVARKCSKPNFTYTDFDTYVSATFYVIKTERVSQKYLVGLLNSSLIAFWLKHRGKMQGNNYQIDKEPIIDLPIIKASQTEEKAIADAVAQIIEAIRSERYAGIPEKQTKIKEYERQIDQMVYKLYDLTQEEIKTMENFNSNQQK